MLDVSDMDDFQMDAAITLDREQRKLVLADMGAGKSVIGLTAVLRMFQRFAIRNVLVVAPKSVAESSWPNEVETWSHLTSLSIMVLTGNGKTDHAMLQQQRAAITVIGTHRLQWLYEHYVLNEDNHTAFWRWDAVILDESSYVKDRRTKVYEAASFISHLVPVWINMTASPAANDYQDLWTQCYLVDHGKALGPNITTFRRKYFVQIGEKRFNNWILKAGAKDEIDKLIAPLCIRIDMSDHMAPREKRVIDHELTLPPKTLKQYRAFMRKKVVSDREFNSVGIEGREIVTFDPGVLWGKLRQWANGSVFIDKTGSWAKVHDVKLDALSEIISTAMEPVIVIYGYTTDKQRILERFPQATLFETSRAKEITKRWNEGKIPILLAHPQSCSHGLNWQYGGRRLVFYTVPVSADRYTQTIGRIDRRGQTKPVFIHRLIMQQTVDAEAVARVENKNAVAESLLDAVKRHLEETV